MSNPPSDTLVELEFVTSLLADSSQFPMVEDISYTMLQDPNLRAIYRIYHGAKGRITPTLLYDDLMKTPDGQAALNAIANDLGVYDNPRAALDELFHAGVTAGPAEIIADRIRNAAIERWIARAVAETKPDRFNDASEFAISLASQITDIAARAAPNTNKNALADGADEELAHWLYVQNNPGKIDGIRVNLGQYDDLTGGLKAGELTLIGGHSGEGKTQIMCHMAMEAATTPHDATGECPSVAFFSLEMGRRQIASRWISKLAGVSMHNALITDEERRAIREAHNKLKDLGNDRKLILVEPHAAHTIEQICRTLINLKNSDDIKIAFIDYAQLIRVSGTSGDRYKELAEVSQRLKLLTEQLGIAIVMGVQLNREALTRSGAGRPETYHIADSMDLIRSADNVHMIWTPARHLTGSNVGGWKGIAVLLTPKRRNGAPMPWLLYAYYPDRATLIPVTSAVYNELMSAEQQDILRKSRPVAGSDKAA